MPGSRLRRSASGGGQAAALASFPRPAERGSAGRASPRLPSLLPRTAGPRPPRRSALTPSLPPSCLLTPPRGSSPPPPPHSRLETVGTDAPASRPLPPSPRRAAEPASPSRQPGPLLPPPAAQGRAPPPAHRPPTEPPCPRGEGPGAAGRRFCGGGQLPPSRERSGRPLGPGCWTNENTKVVFLREAGEKREKHGCYSLYTSGRCGFFPSEIKGFQVLVLLGEAGQVLVLQPSSGTLFSGHRA